MKKYRYVSLMEDNRKKMLKKVNADNLRLLDRIQNVDPVYQADEWERDAEQRDKYLRTMTQFPDYYVSKYSPSRQILNARAREFAEDGREVGGGRESGGLKLPPPSPIRVPVPDGEPTFNGVLRPLSEANLSLPSIPLYSPVLKSAGDR